MATALLSAVATSAMNTFRIGKILPHVTEVNLDKIYTIDDLIVKPVDQVEVGKVFRRTKA